MAKAKADWRLQFLFSPANSWLKLTTEIPMQLLLQIAEGERLMEYVAWQSQWG